MLFSAREHLASHWLDLAEGRLRLDRLNRNGGGGRVRERCSTHQLEGTPNEFALPRDRTGDAKIRFF